MSDDVLLDEACDRVVELEKELAARDARIEDLRNLLHRDRTGLAASLEACMNRACAGRWITEGRGSYEWNDDEYRKETGHLITQIIGIAQNGLGLSGKLADAAFHPDRDRAILEASKSQLATAEAERDEARAWVRKMHAETQILTCVYCGHAYPPGTPASGAEVLTAHVAVCPKHPTAALRTELVRIEGKLRATLNWHHGNLSGFGWGGDLGKTLYAILDSITTLTCAPAAPTEVPHG